MRCSVQGPLETRKCSVHRTQLISSADPRANWPAQESVSLLCFWLRFALFCVCEEHVCEHQGGGRGWVHRPCTSMSTTGPILLALQTLFRSLPALPPPTHKNIPWCELNQASVSPKDSSCLAGQVPETFRAISSMSCSCKWSLFIKLHIHSIPVQTFCYWITMIYKVRHYWISPK